MESAALPKAELHCHLEGILDPGMARDIARDRPDFPIDQAEFASAYPVLDFESFIRWWTHIEPIERNPDWFSPILKKHIERLTAQRVVYLELMIGLGVLPRDASAAVDKLTIMRDMVNNQEDGVIQVEFLAAIPRHRTPEAVERDAELVLALHRAGLIVGTAVAGQERGNPVKPFRNALARLHDAGLGIEIHAGEWCGPESVWDALENGHADRIGHGVTMFQDPKLVDFVHDRRIHLEFCPTSNLKTGSIKRIEEHPINVARKMGLSFSINTDDPGPFECNMSSEYELLSRKFGLTEDDFQRIYANSMSARFQQDLRI
ncbi:adenosine deaminase [Elusimicrobiota bacterium]